MSWNGSDQTTPRRARSSAVSLRSAVASGAPVDEMHRRSFASKGTFGEAEPEGRASVCGPCPCQAKTQSLQVTENKPAVDAVTYQIDSGALFELIAIEGAVWMTMQQMAAVFEVDRSVIGKHIRNVYSTGELGRERTWAKFAQVRNEGGRLVTRNTDFYSLDMVIAVGYRVNSKKATRFRMWATEVLKNYLMYGSAVNARFAKLEGRMTAAERSIHSILYTLMPTLPENREPIGFNVKPK